ncbi:putative indole-3-pyruvate monooxygenase [Helianthus debilis subsp. tardiflorus]
MPFPFSAPTFVPKNMFVQYLKNYVYHFNVDPLYQRSVESARYNKSAQKWVVTAQNNVSGLVEEYVSEFFVVATGENSEGFIPNVYGLDTFKGLDIHSSEYENGKTFGDKDVLVVGAENSGMEIAYDLCNWGAQTSVGVRSPVMTSIKDIQGDIIKFTNGQERQFDAIVFATGFKSTVRKWLKEDGGLFNEKGMPKHKSPNQLKGENGLYCVGFASAGLFGISNDAKNIANDIFRIVDGK